MKVITKSDKYFGYIHVCPSCQEYLGNNESICPNCNQKIEWETWEDIQKRIDSRKNNEVII